MTIRADGYILRCPSATGTCTEALMCRVAALLLTTQPDATNSLLSRFIESNTSLRFVMASSIIIVFVCASE